MAKLRVYPECLLHRLFQDNSFSPFLLEQNNVIKITQPLQTDGNQNRKRITVKKRSIINKKKREKKETRKRRNFGKLEFSSFGRNPSVSRIRRSSFCSNLFHVKGGMRRFGLNIKSIVFFRMYEAFIILKNKLRVNKKI